MAKATSKKEKGHIIMKVYDDFSADFEIDGPDHWLAAGLASGLAHDQRLSTIVTVAAEATLVGKLELEEVKPKKKAAPKKSAPKKKAAVKKKK